MIITAGIYKGRKLSVPDASITRPTLSKVRMGVFNTLFSIIGDFDGKSFLDVFGGSGLMGLEALSRGFSTVKVLEKNPKAAQIIKSNYQKLGIAADLIVGDSLKVLPKLTETFDVAYIDPPYMSEAYETALKFTKAEIIIIEHSQLMELRDFDILKSKNYGGKYVSFLKKM